MAKLSEHHQLHLVFIVFMASFAVLMVILAFKTYKEQVRERVAIEYILRDVSIVEYNKYIKNYND